MKALLAALLLAAGPAAAKDIPITVDPRLETLGIVQMLAGGTPPEGFRMPEGEYARRVKAAFSKYKDQPAVTLTAALPAVFDYRNRTDAVIRRADLPGMGPRWFTPEYMIQQAGGRDKFEAWVAALADFAKTARVAEFVRDNESALEPAVSTFRKDVEGRHYIDKLEKYAGFPYDGEYRVYLAPFILRGSQENSVLRLDDGRYLIMSVVGPDYSGGTLTFRPEDFVATAGHELSHGLIDTLGDLYRERILSASSLYGKLPWPCYNDWHQCVKEDFVRAVMLRLVDSELGPRAEELHLDQEGRAKWPYLQKSAELLKDYEAHRDRWPDLASYYPVMLSVFPPDPPAAAKPLPPSDDAGPGPEWLFEETRPFSTEGQRGLALEYLDRVLKHDRRPLLLRRRAAFRLLQGDAAGAEADADEAAKAEPRDPAVLLARGLARERLGRSAEARADYDAAAAACRTATVEYAVACQNARRMAAGGVAVGAGAGVGPDPNVGPNPALGPGPGAAPDQPPAFERAPRKKGERVDYEFSVDPRVELLAAAVDLARPGGPPPPASFAGLKDHPAVTLLKKALDGGMNEIVPAQLLMTVGPPPELKENGPVSSGLAGPFGGEAKAEEFLAALRDFAKLGRWDQEWASRKADDAAFVKRAEDETKRTLSPEAVESWFGVRFKDHYRFIVSADLPSPFACNASVREGGKRVEIRMRSVMGWRDKNAYFSFDDFAGNVAHELTHTVTDPILLARQGELSAYSALMVPGCTDSWQGCVMEHVNIAATLRALRQESGEAAYRAQLDHYKVRGFPYLPELVERLAEFEQPEVKAKGFAAFLPRVEDVFAQALRAKFRVQAKANVAKTEAASAKPAEAFSETFAADPRVELAVVLHRLSEDAKTRAMEAAGDPAYAKRIDKYFSAFADHPAVKKTALLDASESVRGLPAQLLAHLTPTPALSLRVSVPAGYTASAGGEAARDDWFDAVRAFARESKFFDFFKAEAGYYGTLSAEAKAESSRALAPKAVADYLGRPLQGKRDYALSPLYPSAYPSRLAVFLQGGAEIIRPRAALPGPRFSFDTDDGSTAQEVVYDEASRLVPGSPSGAAGLSEACADRRGPEWPTCEREHLAAAVLIRAHAAGKAPSAEQRARVARETRTLPFLPQLLESLEGYEKDRSAYPSLSDYWPEAEKSFGPAPKAAAATAEDVDAVADFAVDPRVELAGVLLRLSGAGIETVADEETKLADARFAPFRDHPAVARTASLSRGAAAGQTPLRLLLALGDPPELEEKGLPPEPWLSAAGGAAGFRAYAASLRDFVKTASFGAFYDAARPLHRAFTAEARTEALRGASPAAASAYLGVSVPRTRFLLTALLPTSYGTDFSLKDGTATVRTLVWPAAEGPGPSRFRLDQFGDSAVHELVHGVTDGLVPRKFSPGGPVPKGCNDEVGGPDWRACAQEHLVYAVTLRLLALDEGEAAAKAQVAAYAERGYPRLPRLVELLRDYERRRDVYPAFAAFVPKLLTAFGSADADRAAARAARAQSLMEKGVNAYIAGDLKAAAVSLQSAHALAPEDPEVALNLGVVLDKMGDAAGALSAYTHAATGALSAAARRWEIAAAALSSRADLRARQGRRDLARADLSRALEIVPADWGGRADLAKRLEALGR